MQCHHYENTQWSYLLWVTISSGNALGISVTRTNGDQYLPTYTNLAHFIIKSIVDPIVDCKDMYT